MGQLWLIDTAGKVTDISAEIPSGFVLNEANGRYFVFVNPKGQIKYLDPIEVGKTQTSQGGQLSPEQRQRIERIFERWKNEILSKRDDWIAQARAAYDPLAALMPEEYRDSFRAFLQGKFGELYQTQEQEIRRRFEAAMEHGGEIDLSAELPFDRFQKRMQRLLERLIPYVASLESRSYLSQETDVRAKASYYTDVFHGVLISPEIRT